MHQRRLPPTRQAVHAGRRRVGPPDARQPPRPIIGHPAGEMGDRVQSPVDIVEGRRAPRRIDHLRQRVRHAVAVQVNIAERSRIAHPVHARGQQPILVELRLSAVPVGHGEGPVAVGNQAGTPQLALGQLRESLLVIQQSIDLDVCTCSS